MQKYAGLAQTGSIDSKTLSFIRRPRCGVPEFVNEVHDNNEDKLSKLSNGQVGNVKLSNIRVKRYSLQGGKWPRTNLTWR